ncbi:uncharacterized protein [Coffea arabica]|uniref:IST1-like protein n=1 Tax=Coffea arabica TaxID=13443 RepID=A0A6P6XK79_COFAR
MRQLRADIAELLQNGQHKAALSRLHKDELKLSAYDQVDKFCDCVVKNLKDIRPDRKLPVDVCEAISSLIFAASRCGELPELHSLRYLFKGLLGPKFERANVELLPGNTVNSLIKHSLVVKSVAEDVKIQLINDIARDYKQDTGPLSNDGNNGIKDQTRPKKFEEMLPDIGPKFALQDCKDMVTFWSNFPDSSDGTAGYVASKAANTVTFKEKSDDDSLESIRSDGKPIEIEAAPLCFHDREKLHMQGEDIMTGSEYTTLDSSNSFKRSSNTNAADKKCDHLIKPDSVDARYDTAIATNTSQHEEVIGGQCLHNDKDIKAECHVKETKEIPRSPIAHVHPKLPDYDDLVVQFGNLKKEYMRKISNK